MSENSSSHRPRYSTKPSPPYSYVPGHTPHPVSNPRGHMHGHHAPTPSPLEPEHWAESETYRYGVDLFNHGFYWEAHEAWESLWHTAGRTGPMATWLKALIKLAAAAVKVREGNAAGAMRHARRSMDLVHDLETAMTPGPTFCGVVLRESNEIAAGIVAEAELGFSGPAPTRLLDGWIKLDR